MTLEVYQNETVHPLSLYQYVSLSILVIPGPLVDYNFSNLDLY